MGKGTIIYVGHFELPDKNAAAHRVLSNGKIFRYLGYNVVFIQVDKSLDYAANTLELKDNIQGFECWSLPYPKSYKEWIKYLTGIDSIERIINMYDNVKAIIAYNYPSISLYKLKKFSHKQNIKIISDCTEWYSPKGSNLLFRAIKGFDTFLRMRIIQRKMNGLIVISEYLENYYKDCPNVVRIPPLVDLSEKKWNLEPMQIKDDKVRFIYSGTSSKDKDKDKHILIDAFYQLKEYNNFLFKIIGLTKEQYLQNYPDDREKLNELKDRIHFYGRVPHSDSLKLLKESDFSIFFRDNTRVTKAGFPTKFVESISTGIPVVTTRTSDSENYLEEGINGFFITGNISENTKQVLKKLLGYNNESIQDMKIECLNLRCFHYENFTEILDKFIHNVIGYPSGGGINV